MAQRLYRICMICILFVTQGVWLPGVFAEDAHLQYDRGSKAGTRHFQVADACLDTPCVVTQHGAWQFGPSVTDRYRIELGYVHEGSYRSLDIVQQSTTLEERLGERLLNRYPNRKVINLARTVERGDTQVIYIYGLRLQYDLSEGDPLVVRLVHVKDAKDVLEYYFRYHHDGAQPDLDLAFLYPLNIFHPNPGGNIKRSDAGVAFSLSVARTMDPEQHYSWVRKMFRAVRLNMFAGVINRGIVQRTAGDAVIRDRMDGFAGLGVTAFDFFFVGYGVNLIRSPHAGFPFQSFQVGKVSQCGANSW
jgi:hypothetical protein